MKLGIMGNGSIVQVAINTFATMPEMDVKAILCRKKSEERTRDLARSYDIEKIYTNMDEFLANPSFDTVYVAVVNTLHYEYSKRALEAGKNVICEKPFATSGKETRELIDLAKEKGCMLFEAVPTRYQDNYALIASLLDQIGPVKMIQANYSQYSRRYDKYKEGVVLPAFDPAQYGGALFDLNIYNLHFVVGLFGLPNQASYFANRGLNGVDVSGTAVLDYGSFKAVLSAAKDSASKPFVILQGEKGTIEVHSMPSEVNSVTLTMHGQSTQSIGEDQNDRFKVQFGKIDRILEAKDTKRSFADMEKTYNVMALADELRSQVLE